MYPQSLRQLQTTGHADPAVFRRPPAGPVCGSFTGTATTYSSAWSRGAFSVSQRSAFGTVRDPSAGKDPKQQLTEFAGDFLMARDRVGA